MFSIKNSLKEGDALTPLLFNISSEYVITRVQLNQVRLKLNATRQLLFCAVDVNILGGRVHAIKKNAEALLIASMVTGLEVIAEKLLTTSCSDIRMQYEVTT
jgi:hypothetical protein